jgi:hypothetical protein
MPGEAEDGVGMGKWNHEFRWPAEGVMVVHQACRSA